MHTSSKCDIIKYVTPCLYHIFWWNGWCDIIEVRVYHIRTAQSKLLDIIFQTLQLSNFTETLTTSHNLAQTLTIFLN